MGRRKSRAKKNKNKQQSRRPPPRFVAYHPEVVQALEDWSMPGRKQRVFAKKVQTLGETFLTGEERDIQLLFRQMKVDPIHGASKLVELGSKQQRGGAQRVFVLRYGNRSAFFVAAGVEKGTSGAAEMGKARSRAKEIQDCEPPESISDVDTLWGAEYELVVP